MTGDWGLGKIIFPITNHQSPITNHQSPVTNLRYNHKSANFLTTFVNRRCFYGAYVL
ncbi:hypothetical protein IQ227_09215 [Anabaena aphanizomenioides LEGE 00250]|uniref:Uncharacterized protein n=1 Tax=Sphaerospermopsis aphanizomenoides LEGE 00250 TaxID=2777972 RepID=A0ABR9VCL8_9CYAN|nr:hypothetical protein [Sphaerospermopsis aphanizomenoides]MBE9236203.1 hypothetical protein [Sphaerospermopsis aphanizomenoides LEGE 00250]